MVKLHDGLQKKRGFRECRRKLSEALWGIMPFR